MQDSGLSSESGDSEVVSIWETIELRSSHASTPKPAGRCGHGEFKSHRLQAIEISTIIRAPSTVLLSAVFIVIRQLLPKLEPAVHFTLVSSFRPRLLVLGGAISLESSNLNLVVKYPPERCKDELDKKKTTPYSSCTPFSIRYSGCIRESLPGLYCS